jgi:dTDP-4-dehydrorhamnose reductase
MRLLLLGRYGQLGWELNRTLAPLGQVMAYDYPDVDLTNLEHLRALIREVVPDVIVNAIAYTAVDRAEGDSETALTVNGHAPGLMAEEAAKLGCVLIHFSTDYVFDGTKHETYVEEDATNPINVYGYSKLVGEQGVQQIGGAYLILRTSWVYSLRRDNFVTKVLQWSRSQETLSIVTDQIGNPTWCRMLAEITALLLSRGGEDVAAWINERRGLYHLAGSGYASRFEWAGAIMELDPHPDEQKVTRIQPALSADFPTPAKRPLFSALNCDKFKRTFGLQLPDWREALVLAMEVS